MHQFLVSHPQLAIFIAYGNSVNKTFTSLEQASTLSIFYSITVFLSVEWTVNEHISLSFLTASNSPFFRFFRKLHSSCQARHNNVSVQKNIQWNSRVSRYLPRPCKLLSNPTPYWLLMMLFMDSREAVFDKKQLFHWFSEVKKRL